MGGDWRADQLAQGGWNGGGQGGVFGVEQVGEPGGGCFAAHAVALAQDRKDVRGKRVDEQCRGGRFDTGQCRDGLGDLAELGSKDRLQQLRAEAVDGGCGHGALVKGWEAMEQGSVVDGVGHEPRNHGLAGLARRNVGRGRSARQNRWEGEADRLFDVSWRFAEQFGGIAYKLRRHRRFHLLKERHRHDGVPTCY